MAFEIFAKKEIPSEVESEMKEIYRLAGQREFLQARWSELFKEEENLRKKYPQNVQFDEHKKFKSDFSFLMPDDMKKFKKAENEMRGIEEKRDEIDKEILRMRFGAGFRYLEELLNRDDIQWRLIEDYTSNPQNPYGALRVKKWLAKVGNDIVEVEFSAGKPVSFIEGVKEAAARIGDGEILQRLGKWSQERKIPYRGYYLGFLCGPKKTRRFDRYFLHNEKDDKTEVELLLSPGARAFPKITEAETDRAKKALIQLQDKLKLENL